MIDFDAIDRKKQEIHEFFIANFSDEEKQLYEMFCKFMTCYENEQAMNKQLFSEFLIRKQNTGF